VLWRRVRDAGLRGILLVLALLLAPAATEAQQVARPWRLGYLSAATGPAPSEPFRAALRDLGYVEGQNLVVEARYAEAKFERLPQLALELVKLGPDVIVALGAAEVIGRAFGRVLAVNGPTRPNKAPRRRL